MTTNNPGEYDRNVACRVCARGKSAIIVIASPVNDSFVLHDDGCAKIRTRHVTNGAKLGIVIATAHFHSPSASRSA